MTLTLPYPVLLNRLYTPLRGRMVLSDEAKAYKQAAGLLARTQWEREPLPGALELTLVVYRPTRAGDIDAPLKLLLDTLEGVVYVNDRQIEVLHVYKRTDARDPRVVVTVEEM